MSENIQLRIKQDNITLEVNDNGDVITLPVSDERFIQKLLSFSEKVNAEQQKLSTVDETDITEMVNADMNFHEMLKTEFNVLFGERAYEKVYGEDITVGVEYILEFIDACLPYIEQHTQNRVNKLSKYSANRVGSSL